MSSVSNVHLNEFGSSPLINQKKDLIDVTCDYVGEKHYGFLKACYVLPGFLIEMDYLPSDHHGLNRSLHGAKLAKLSRAPVELIKYVHETRTSLSNWLSGKGEKKVGVLDVVRSANNMINPFNEGADFLSKTLVSIPGKTLSTLKGVSGGSLVFGMGCNLFETLAKIKNSKYSELKGAARAKEFTKMTQNMIKLAMQVSYVALGALSFLMVFTQFVATPLTMTALSAATVVFTILQYYHEHLGEDKSKN